VVLYSSVITMMYGPIKVRLKMASTLIKCVHVC